MDRVDILLKNGIIVTVDEDNTIFDRGDIAIKDGKIFDLGKDLKLDAKKTEDLMGAIVMPGLINTHTHAAMTLFRGLADDLPLMEWLNNHIFPAEASLTPDLVYTGTLLACLEMIKAGTTTFCDMYFFEEQVIKASKKAGLRVFAGEGIINFPTPSCETPQKAIEETKKLFSKYSQDPLVNICVAPHSVYLTDKEYLLAGNEFAQKNNLPIIIHAAESNGEIEQVMEKTGKRSIEYLNEIGLLSENLLSVHSVMVNENEIELFRKNNVKISHNPESNMKLASGIAPIPEYLEAGICVSLGTDGAASNNDLCLLSEMDTAAKLHKVNKMDPTVLSARQALRMSTIDGAKALGIEDKTGSIEKGKDADIVILDPSLPGLTPIYYPESHIVYAASRREVKDVYIMGNKVLDSGNILTTDTSEVIESAIRASKQIKKNI